MDYKFGQKNQWRRWVWNRIVERLAVPARDAVVVYLGAEDDHDRQEALRRGFRNDNLLLVDSNAEVVSARRRAGALAVEGDLFDVIHAWPGNRRIDCIHGDFCNGLTLHNWMRATTTWFVAPASREAVLSFNLLRGRDPSSNDVRERAQERRAIWGALMNDGAKHRGRLLIAGASEGAFDVFNGFLWVGPDGRFDWTPELDDSLRARKWQQQIPRLMDHMNPAFHSYRSTKHQTFDSAVWVCPTRGLDLGAEWGAVDAELRAATKGSQAAMRRQISAVLAHQTRRRGAPVGLRELAAART